MATTRATRGLAASLLLLAGSAAAAPAASADWPALGRSILKQLVEIDTTHAKGSTAAAEAAAERLIAAGFPRDDVTLIAPPGHPTKGNLIVRLRGKGKAKPILYMGHLDVVEAERRDWSVDPFRLTEKDGYLYGRGTIDMKGQDTAMLVALIRLKREGFVPDRDIILMLTADEEAGGDQNGPDFLLKQHRSLIDAAFAINPDTAGEAALKDGHPFYLGVETGEKIYLTYEISATDKGGHSSEPTPANPINHVAAAVAKLAAFKFPVDLTETTRRYFARRAALETGQRARDMLAASAARPDPAALARLSADPETDLWLRTTCTATEFQGGQSESALPERAVATIQCRVIPGESQESITRTLTTLFADPAIRFTVTSPAMASPESPLPPAVAGAIEHVAGALFPSVPILPLMDLGASDGAFTRSAGIPTYGVDAMFVELGDDRAHGRDERISIAAFDRDLDFTYRLMKALSRLP